MIVTKAGRPVTPVGKSGCDGGRKRIAERDYRFVTAGAIDGERECWPRWRELAARCEERLAAARTRKEQARC